MLYRDFYPKWKHYYTTQSHGNCSAEFDLYQNQTLPTRQHNAACIDMALCLMQNSVKNIQSQTASTGVLLGLLPSILSILGSNPVELGLLSTRRPVLSLLLALAAPVVNPIRLFDYVNPKDMLTKLKQEVNKTKRKKMISALIVFCQFVLAIAAVANITMVAADLYSKAYSIIIACSGRYLIFLWNVLAALLWLAGRRSLMSRSRFELIQGGTAGAPQSGTSWPDRLYNRAKRWLGHEFSTCVQHEERGFYWNPENQWYFWYSQALALGTVGHILFGTAILSGYQFIAPVDALWIVVRYAASAWISRLILKSELAGLSAQTEIPQDAPNKDAPGHIPWAKETELNEDGGLISLRPLRPTQRRTAYINMAI